MSPAVRSGRSRRAAAMCGGSASGRTNDRPVPAWRHRPAGGAVAPASARGWRRSSAREPMTARRRPVPSVTTENDGTRPAVTGAARAGAASLGRPKPGGGARRRPRKELTDDPSRYPCSVRAPGLAPPPAHADDGELAVSASGPAARQTLPRRVPPRPVGRRARPDRRYGAGETAVEALRGVSLEHRGRQADRGDGARRARASRR